MDHIILQSLAVGAVGLIASRVGDRLLKFASTTPRAKVEKSSVVWPYAATDNTAASSAPRGVAKHVVLTSPQ